MRDDHSLGGSGERVSVEAEISFPSDSREIGNGSFGARWAAPVRLRHCAARLAHAPGHPAQPARRRAGEGQARGDHRRAARNSLRILYAVVRGEQPQLGVAAGGCARIAPAARASWAVLSTSFLRSWPRATRAPCKSLANRYLTRPPRKELFTGLLVALQLARVSCSPSGLWWACGTCPRPLGALAVLL